MKTVNRAVAGWDLPPWLVLGLALALALAAVLILSRPHREQRVYHVPGDFPTIQEAIDRAPPMSAIVLQAQVYKENLVIKRSLTLLSPEGGEAVIEAAREAAPVIEVEGGAVVSLQNVAITGSSGGCVGGARTGPGSGVVCPYALLIRGRAQVFLIESRVSDNALGIRVAERGRLRVVASQVTNNNGNGVEVRDAAQVSIERSRLVANGGSGLWTISSGQTTVRETEISGNGAVGLGAAEGAQLTVEDSQIVENGEDGIWAKGSARVTLRDVRIARNGRDGLHLLEGAQATVRDSLIVGNGTSARCEEELPCSGIELVGRARLELRGSTVRGHPGWGVAAHLERCGFSHDEFTGRASLVDVEITDNGRGQVCLPTEGSD